jgi:hypothetical protein
LNHPQVKPLLSDEHFSVDGTLIEAWASQKSFRAKDGGDNEGDGADFRDFGAAFGCPVKVANDAAMQALGSYMGGKMLFLGLGTGLGSTIIVDGIVEPMELSR